jgi:hypothetical protein
MHVKHIAPVAVAMVVALLLFGCSQRELDCKNPRNAGRTAAMRRPSVID